MAEPLLFLDVDGVLNACPPIPGEEVVVMNNYPICIPTGTKERIRQLLNVFEPVWATTWRGDAHPHFWEPLDLGEEPWPHIDSEAFGAWKLPAIIEFAVERRLSGPDFHRPWVWIDDDGPWEGTGG